MATEFSGKTAVVTGASRGIGAATAIALARAGVSRVVIQYNSYAEGAEQTMEQIRAAGAEAAAIQADLGTAAGVDQCIAAIRERCPAVDILVNNAGSLVARATLANGTADVYDRIMTLNVKSVWMITQAVAPLMIARRGGVIVNLSSIAARNGGGPGATIYAAAKAAVAAMTKGMAKELAPHGIRVNAISPGVVDNYFHEQFSTPEMLEQFRKTIPLGRLGSNEDMAGPVVFLCSEAAGYITGQTIEINGGQYMI